MHNVVILVAALLGISAAFTCTSVTGYNIVKTRVGNELLTFSLNQGVIRYTYTKNSAAFAAWAKYGEIVEYEGTGTYDPSTSTVNASISLQAGWAEDPSTTGCTPIGATDATVVIAHAASGMKISCRVREVDIQHIKCDITVNSFPYNSDQHRISLKNLFVWVAAQGSSFRNASACIGGNSNSICVDTTQFPGYLLAFDWAGSVQVGATPGVTVSFSVWANATNLDFTDLGKMSWFSFDHNGAGSAAFPLTWDPQFTLDEGTTSSAAGLSFSALVLLIAILVAFL
jgi:hypothetical protein